MTAMQTAKRILDERSLLEETDPAKLESISWIRHLVELVDGDKIQDIVVCDVAIQIGAQVLEERCPKCGVFMLQKPDQDWPFCWICVTGNEALQRAKTCLAKARLLERGIVMEPSWSGAVPAAPVDDDDEEWWGFALGMPL